MELIYFIKGIVIGFAQQQFLRKNVFTLIEPSTDGNRRFRDCFKRDFGDRKLVD